MDRDRELNEAKAEQAQQKQMGTGAIYGGIGQDTCNQMYSPRLGVLRQIDEATDDLLARVAKLREFRKSIERSGDREASLVEQAISMLQPRP